MRNYIIYIKKLRKHYFKRFEKTENNIFFNLHETKQYIFKR